MERKIRYAPRGDLAAIRLLAVFRGVFVRTVKSGRSVPILQAPQTRRSTVKKDVSEKLHIGLGRTGTARHK